MSTDLLFVFGTRPEAIKIGPVVAAARKPGINPIIRVLCTGQHTSLLKGSPAESDLVDAENCGLASDGNVVRWLTRAQDVMRDQFDHLTPRMVVVQGDTMSALAAASAAHMDGIPVAHIEAGIRSHNPDNPWPEETTRVSIAEMAEWHYAPTDTALKNLDAVCRAYKGSREEHVALQNSISVISTVIQGNEVLAGKLAKAEAKLKDETKDVDESKNEEDDKKVDS